MTETTAGTDKLAVAGADITAAIELLTTWQTLVFEETQGTPLLRMFQASGRAAEAWTGCYSSHTHGSSELGEEITRTAFAALVALAALGGYDPLLSLADHARQVLESPTYAGLPGSRCEIDGEDW
jgi:hypothetical protein